MSERTPLTEAERESLTNCDCGHDIGGEHNGRGCYGTVAYGTHKQRRCTCPETDNRPGVNYAAVERLLAARTSTATADTGLRERVEHLVIMLERGERVPYWAIVEARAALDATAAPTTEPGARDG